MPRKDAGIGVIAAASTAADQHRNRFAVIEFLDALRRAGRRAGGDRQNQSRERVYGNPHRRERRQRRYFCCIAAKKPSDPSVSIKLVST